MNYSYFPGCAAHGTAVDQHLSTTAVLNALEIELTALSDWNCCGATPGHTVGGEMAIALSTRNIEIAAKIGRPLVVPCAACFNNLRKASAKLGKESASKSEPVEVISIATLLATPLMLDIITKKISVSLKELTIAPYYGCLLTRPIEITGATDPENPMEIDKVAAICGAKVAPWSNKTDCCGGPHTLAHPELVTKMSTPLLEMAVRWGADLVVTACPMCHASLDATLWNQRRENKNAPFIPVLYLTELVALALDIPHPDRWLKRHLVDPRPLLRQKGAL